MQKRMGRHSKEVRWRLILKFEELECREKASNLTFQKKNYFFPFQKKDPKPWVHINYMLSKIQFQLASAS